MPSNIPPELEEKFASCKEKVMADGRDEEAAVAICYVSVVEGKSLADAMKSYDLEALKVGARNSATDAQRLQSIHDLAVENGATCHREEYDMAMRSLDVAIKAPPEGHEFYGNQYTGGGGGGENRSSGGRSGRLTGSEQAGKRDIAKAQNNVGKMKQVSEEARDYGEIDFQTADYIASLAVPGDATREEISGIEILLRENKSPKMFAETVRTNSLLMPTTGDAAFNMSIHGARALTTKSMGCDVVSFGSSIKAMDNGHIGGYLVTFGSPDQTDASPARDFFTKNTDFGDLRTTPVYFNHRLPIKARNGKEIIVKDKIGEGTLTVDDNGVFIDAVLYNREQYEKALSAMGWSSGTAQHLVERKAHPNGSHEITAWPLGLDGSITPMPAEPRTRVIPLKSLGDYLPDTIELPEAGEGESASAAGEGNPAPINDYHSEDVEMNDEEIKALIAQAAQQGAEAALKSLPPITPPVGVQVTKDEADQPWAKPGEFFRAVKTAAYYPSQEDPRLRSLKATGMSEGIPADGGYLVPPAMASGIIERTLNVGQILSRVSRDTVAGNSMVYNGIDETTHQGSLYGGLIGYWLAEAGTKSATKPKFYQLSLKLKKIAALAYATDELLEDVAALESWLGRTVPNVLRWYVESAIISGDGVGKPLGITQSPCLVPVLREDANEVNPSDFANMWARRYLGVNDYVWLVNPTVTAQMNLFSVGTMPVYMPQGSMVGVPHGTLYGAPVIESEHVAAFKSAGDVLLCSLSQYQTITKGDVQSASSIHVAFTTDETAFRFVYRIDGAPTWQSALQPALGDTISPFLSLSAASS